MWNVLSGVTKAFDDIIETVDNAVQDGVLQGVAGQSRGRRLKPERAHPPDDAAPASLAGTVKVEAGPGDASHAAPAQPAPQASSAEAAVAPDKGLAAFADSVLASPQPGKGAAAASGPAKPILSGVTPGQPSPLFTVALEEQADAGSSPKVRAAAGQQR